VFADDGEQHVCALQLGEQLAEGYARSDFDEALEVPGTNARPLRRRELSVVDDANGTRRLARREPLCRLEHRYQ
jgi:hypothetical protein